MDQVNGKVIATDGWRMEWDLDSSPPQIDVWNKDGVWQYTVSGEIDQRKVKRDVKKFQQEHCGQTILTERTI